MTDGPHKIDVSVTTTSGDNPWIIDYLLVFSNSNSGPAGVVTTRPVPSHGPATATPTSTTSPNITVQPTPVGAIVGGVVGGIAGIAILIFALWYFLKGRRSRRGGEDTYFEKAPENTFSGEYRAEPLTPAPANPPWSAGSGGTGPQYPNSNSGQSGSNPGQWSPTSDGSGPQYSSHSSNQPLNPAPYQSLGQANEGFNPNQTGPTQPGPRKVALMNQPYRSPEQPTQLAKPQPPSPSQVSTALPSYTAQQ